MSKVENVSIYGPGDSRDAPAIALALQWEVGNDRYHVWTNDKLKPSELPTRRVIYKNPHPKLDSRDQRYFSTRKLRLDVPKNMVMFETARAVAQQCGLVEEFFRAGEENDAARLEEYKAAAALQRVKDAAPELLAALKDVLKGERLDTLLARGMTPERAAEIMALAIIHGGPL